MCFINQNIFKQENPTLGTTRQKKMTDDCQKTQARSPSGIDGSSGTEQNTKAPSCGGFGATPHKGFGESPKSFYVDSGNGFGSAPPSNKGFGAAPPSNKGFGAAPPSNKGFGAAPPSNKGFGAAPASAPAPNQGSLSGGFGAAPASAPNQGSLSGGFGAAPASAPNQGSLSGGFGAAPASAPNQGSLSGGFGTATFPPKSFLELMAYRQRNNKTSTSSQNAFGAIRPKRKVLSITSNEASSQKKPRTFDSSLLRQLKTQIKVREQQDIAITTADTQQLLEIVHKCQRDVHDTKVATLEETQRLAGKFDSNVKVIREIQEVTLNKAAELSRLRLDLALFKEKNSAIVRIQKEQNVALVLSNNNMEKAMVDLIDLVHEQIRPMDATKQASPEVLRANDSDGQLY